MPHYCTQETDLSTSFRCHSEHRHVRQELSCFCLFVVFGMKRCRALGGGEVNILCVFVSRIDFQDRVCCVSWWRFFSSVLSFGQGFGSSACWPTMLTHHIFKLHIVSWVSSRRWDLLSCHSWSAEGSADAFCLLFLSFFPCCQKFFWIPASFYRLSCGNVMQKLDAFSCFFILEWISKTNHRGWWSSCHTRTFHLHHNSHPIIIRSELCNRTCKTSQTSGEPR